MPAIRQAGLSNPQGNDMPKIIKTKKQDLDITYMRTGPDPDIHYTIKIYEPSHHLKKKTRQKIDLRKIMDEIIKIEKKRKKMNLADVMKT